MFYLYGIFCNHIYCILYHMFSVFAEAMRRSKIFQPSDFEIKEQIINHLKHGKDRKNARIRREKLNKLKKHH